MRLTYEQMKELARQSGKRGTDLIALAAQNMPFSVDRSAEKGADRMVRGGVAAFRVRWSGPLARVIAEAVGCSSDPDVRWRKIRAELDLE